MKNAYFFLSALAASLFFVSCSDDKGTAEEVTYQKTNTYITTLPEKQEGRNGELEGFYMITGFNALDECLLSRETYVSFEMYSDNELQFIDGYTGPDGIAHVIQNGVLHMTNENIYLFGSEPWNPGNLNSEFDYYQYLPVTAASGEGTYVFALKFYQPESGKYFITSVYQMDVWLAYEGLGVMTKTTLTY